MGLSNLLDVIEVVGCISCSQLTPRKRLYGTTFLMVCDKCVVSCGPAVRDFLLNLSEDYLERQVQLAMMETAARDFAKLLTNKYTLALNEGMCELLHDMRDAKNGFNLESLPTSGAVQ